MLKTATTVFSAMVMRSAVMEHAYQAHNPARPVRPALRTMMSAYPRRDARMLKTATTVFSATVMRSAMMQNVFHSATPVRTISKSRSAMRIKIIALNAGPVLTASQAKSVA
jgi:hypothetical protein